MVKLQKQYKNHRKTVNFTGERMKIKNWRGETVDLMPSSANDKVRVTKESLRHHYIAHKVLRSRLTLEEFKQNNMLDLMEQKRKEEPSWSQIEKIVEKYQKDFVWIEEAA
jgi:hypothetical protein